MTLRDDTRGASIPVTHAMTIAITALLLSSLLLGAGSFLNRQQDTVAREQLAEIGGDLANLLNGVDRLNATGEEVSVTIEPGYPRTVAGTPYSVDLVTASGSDTEGQLILDSTAVGHPVRIPISTDTPIDDDTAARGESPTVVLESDGSGNNCIGFNGCDPPP